MQGFSWYGVPILFSLFFEGHSHGVSSAGLTTQHSHTTILFFVTMKGIAAMIASGRKLTAATFNIAAINNNPFEYWITYNENPAYEKDVS